MDYRDIAMDSTGGILPPIVAVLTGATHGVRLELTGLCSFEDLGLTGPEDHSPPDPEHGRDAIRSLLTGALDQVNDDATYNAARAAAEVATLEAAIALPSTEGQ